MRHAVSGHGHRPEHGTGAGLARRRLLADSAAARRSKRRVNAPARLAVALFFVWCLAAAGGFDRALEPESDIFYAVAGLARWMRLVPLDVWAAVFGCAGLWFAVPICTSADVSILSPAMCARALAISVRTHTCWSKVMRGAGIRLIAAARSG